MSGVRARRRVLLLTMDFPPVRGGIQTMAREIVARSTWDLRVIAPRDRGWEQVDASIPVPVHRVGSIAPGRRGFVPSVALAARRAVRRWQPDLCVALHVLAAPGALWSRAPLVVVCHGGELRSNRIRMIARRVLPRAQHVVANSRYTRSHAVALGADPLKITVLPVGAPDPVDVPRDRVEGLRRALGDGRIVLSVSRLEEHKGHDRLIEAVAQLPADVRLVLVGDGSARASLEALAARAGVAGRVVFAGSVADDELPAYFASADVFALLSRATTGPTSGVEGGGIALLEACAYGLPVIAAATGGIPETIADGETGLLVDPDNGAAVVRTLTRVLGDDGLASALGARARAMATGDRSWTHFVERMERLWETIAVRGREVRS